MSVFLPEEHHYASMEALSDQLAQRILNDLKSLPTSHAETSLVVSGGNTPKALYQKLATASFDWSGVQLILSDERWVPISHERRNEKMLQETWLSKCAQCAPKLGTLIPNLAESEERNLKIVEQELRKNSKPFRWVILGMGLDGHTASLFPSDPSVQALMSTQQLCAIAQPEGQPEKRVTLTPAALLNSRRIIVLIQGAEKYNVYQQSLAQAKVLPQADDDLGAALTDMPVRFLWRQNQVPVDVYVC